MKSVMLKWPQGSIYVRNQMLDKLGQKLIRELQRNGRQSHTELARKLEVSEGTVRRRVSALQKQGFMKIAAVLNPYKFGYNFVSVMGIQVRMTDLQQVADMLAQRPNVYYMAFVTGRYDLLIILISRTSEEVSHFIKKYISSIPSIIRTETFVNLEIIKSPWAEPETSFDPFALQEED